MSKMLQEIQQYATGRSVRHHRAIALISFIIYVSVILFGFVPTSNELEQSGYSMSDLQGATSTEEMDKILAAWEEEGLTDVAVRLTVLDYLFIISGFMLFVSLNALLIRVFENREMIRYIPTVGILLTALSRLLDSLENLWAFLIYANPDSYPSFLIPLLNITTIMKWAIVGLEYSTVAIGFVIYCILAIKNYSSKNEPKINLVIL